MNLEKVEIEKRFDGRYGKIVCVVTFGYKNKNKNCPRMGIISCFGIYFPKEEKANDENDLHFANLTNEELKNKYGTIREDLSKTKNMLDVINVLKKHNRTKELNMLMYCLIKGEGVTERK
jgi:hypothetical protein